MTPGARVVAVASLVLLAFSSILLGLFAFGQTQFFLLLGLSDPAHPEWTLLHRGSLEQGTLAGYWCGLLISSVLAAATAVTCWVFVRHVSRDAAALDAATRTWEEKRVDFLAGSLSADGVLAGLREAVPAGTRLARVFEAWSAPGHKGDVEALVEARASVPRQVLSYLVTVASTLVLIGLVGNFFGLAEAVRQIPDLKQAQVQPAGTPSPRVLPPASGTETGTVQLGSGKTITKLSTYDARHEQPTAPAPVVAGHDRSGSLLMKISAGLSVVVVSSVMGIGAMLILLLHAAAVRGVLNSLVAQELALVGSQLAPHLRPSAVERLAASLEAFSALPDALQTIRGSSESFASAVLASDQHIQAMAGSIGQLVRHQLVDTRQAYARYHESLAEFSQVLSDQRGLITSLASSTVQLVEGLTGVSREVSALAEDSRRVHQSYRDAHVEYERYLRASLERGEMQHSLLRDTCRELTSTAQREAREATDVHRRVLDESSQRTAGILQGQLDLLLQSHRASLGTLEGTLTASSEGARGAIREACAALVEVRGSFQKVYDRTTASFDACLQELVDETRASLQEAQASAAVVGDEARATVREAAVALTEVRRKFHEVYDRVSVSFENATLALLELHEDSYGRLQESQVGAVAELMRQVSEHGALLASARDAAASNGRDSQWAEALRGVVERHAEEMRDLVAAGAESHQRLETLLERLAQALAEHGDELRATREMALAAVASSARPGEGPGMARDQAGAGMAAPAFEPSDPGHGAAMPGREAQGEGALAPGAYVSAETRRPFFRNLVAGRHPAGRGDSEQDGPEGP